MKNRELIEKLLLLDLEADIVIDSPHPEQQGVMVAAVSVTEVQGKFQETQAADKFILIR